MSTNTNNVGATYSTGNQSVIDVNSTSSVETNNIVRPFNLKHGIIIFCICIITVLIGGYIFVTTNYTTTYVCIKQVHILNNIIDVCNMNQSRFNENGCYFDGNYCNHITKKIKNDDDICEDINNICFKQKYIITSNIILLFITLFCSLFFSCAIYILFITITQYRTISRNKYDIYILLLLILIGMLLYFGFMNNSYILIYIALELEGLLLFSSIFGCKNHI